METDEDCMNYNAAERIKNATKNDIRGVQKDKRRYDCAREEVTRCIDI